MNSRFDYVKYDNEAERVQKFFKEKVTEIEEHIGRMGAGRAQSLAITALEECYMWIGKAIRDEQIKRNGSAPLQESRNNG